MKKTIIQLPLENSRYLTLEFLGPVEELYLFDGITISYHANKKYILFTKYFVIESLKTFEYVLKLALNNQFIIHESIQQDIGFLWGEYLQENESNYHFVKKPLENSTIWVGAQHHLFSSKQWDTWLYNKNGDIYLEITPAYPWHFGDPKKNEKFVPYEEFIKNYKPLVILKIDKERAEEWLKIVSNLVAIAEKNYEHWSNEAAEG